MTVELVWATPNAEQLITRMARVSNPDNEDNMETAPKLLRYLIKHRHWSPFELANMCVKINTQRDISAQILRHRSFTFQEFCLAGNSRITVKPINGHVQRIQIKDLYKKFKKHSFKARYARAYDPKLNRFIEAKIKNVFYTGKKETYEYTIKTEKGAIKKICCTKEHKVYTKELGFVDFEIANKNNLTVGINGQKAEPLLYQQKETLEEYAWMGSTAYAKHFGIAEVTARKWFRHHGVIPVKPNHVGKSSINLSFESRLAKFMQWARNNLLKTECENCQHDGFRYRLELSHIFNHDGDPILAFNEHNLQTLCSKCHREFDIKSQQKHFGWTLGMSAKWGKIIKVVSLGIQDTYDIEMNHPTHNFVADGIIVHNSTRYAEITNGVDVPALRRQDTKNRQNSFDDLDDQVIDKYTGRILDLFTETHTLYTDMLKDGIAKETARRILPLSTNTTMYMNGTLRSWIHYIDLRADVATQLEHRMIAEAIKQIFCEQFPIIGEAAFNG